MSTEPNPSGASGFTGRIADWWDRKPVVGAVAVIAAVGGTVAALASGGPGQGECDTTPLRHVYKPSRLKVLERCARVTGTVVTARHEHDGDWHVNMRIDQPGWTNPANDRGQHGLTVVEFTPLDPRPPRFRAGMRLSVLVTKVADQQHKRRTEDAGWIEGHPVFAVADITPAAEVTRPAPLGPKVEEGEEGEG